MEARTSKTDTPRRAVQALGALARGWDSRDTLSILLFHRVLATPDPLIGGTPTVDSFSDLMRLLRRHCSPLSLAEGLERLADGSLPARAVCITFDDGYADNLHNALPVLTRYAVPATVFTTTAFLHGGLMWNDRVIEAVRRFPGDRIPLESIGLSGAASATEQQRAQLIHELLTAIKHRPPAERAEAVAYLEGLSPGEAPELMMTVDQLRELAAAGVEIGAHTHSHPILAALDDGAAREEITRGKDALEAALQQDIRFFAYPNGRRGADYSPRDVALVRDSGFQAALTTDFGANRQGIDRYQLQRFTPWDAGKLRFLARMIHHRGAASLGPPAEVPTLRAEMSST